MFKRIVVVFGILLSLAGCASMLEQPRYTLVRQYEDFEVRRYAPYVVAETTVAGDMEEVGNEGFRRLAAYIKGENEAGRSIAMTAPVTHETGGQKIAMTAPVTQQADRSGATIRFMMPSEWTLDALPRPTDERISLREMPGRTVAVIRYSGSWSKELYDEQLAELRAHLERAELETVGEPVWARYNPPFTPAFLRRNEIMLELKDGGKASPAES